MEKRKIKAIAGIILIIGFFLLSSYIIQNNIGNLKEIIDRSYTGAILYILIEVLATVIAPVSATPLMPIASNIYGWKTVAILNIIGWTIGSTIAFLLARKYGMPLVKRLISLENIEKFEKRIPRENMFWSIVFLRMIIPADFLSYVLGLFTRIRLKTYFWATLIGIIPFAIILSYLGALPFTYQIIGLSALLIITILSIISIKLGKKILRKSQRAKPKEQLSK